MMELRVIFILSHCLVYWTGFVTAQTADPCPVGYEEGYSGQCYLFETIKGSWSKSRTQCRNITDSDLVIINNSEELDYIKDRVTDGIWWIGYTDISVEGTWTWLDCNKSSLWNQSLWAPNQPNNGVEDCGAFQGAVGLLADYECSGRNYGFICEISKKEFSIEDTNVHNVAAVAVNETTVRVTWDVSPYNCDVIGYRVYYQQNDNPNNNGSVQVFGGNKTETDLYSLTPYVWWEIYIAASHEDQVLDLVGPAFVWLGETQTTPAYSTADAILIIVFNQNVGWFSSMMRVKLASAIAEVLNRYNISADHQRVSSQEFDPSNVMYLSVYNVPNDLHIVTWVRDVTSTEPGAPLDPTVVLNAISTQQDYFQTYMGPTFKYSVSLQISPTSMAPPSGGLDAGQIAGICVGAAVLLLLLVVGAIIAFKCGSDQTKKNKSLNLQIANEHAGGTNKESFKTTSFS